jgi:hypothetical protein
MGKNPAFTSSRDKKIQFVTKPYILNPNDTLRRQRTVMEST